MQRAYSNDFQTSNISVMHMDSSLSQHSDQWKKKKKKKKKNSIACSKAQFHLLTPVLTLDTKEQPNTGSQTRHLCN